MSITQCLRIIIICLKKCNLWPIKSSTKRVFILRKSKTTSKFLSKTLKILTFYSEVLTSKNKKTMSFNKGSLSLKANKILIPKSLLNKIGRSKKYTSFLSPRDSKKKATPFCLPKISNLFSKRRINFLLSPNSLNYALLSIFWREKSEKSIIKPVTLASRKISFKSSMLLNSKLINIVLQIFRCKNLSK